MNELEDELRSLLRRKDPPAGFAARVLARTRSGAGAWRGWAGAGIAACLLLSAGAFEYRQYEGRKAKNELLLAIGMAGSKLNIAQQKVFDLSQRTIHE